MAGPAVAKAQQQEAGEPQQLDQGMPPDAVLVGDDVMPEVKDIVVDDEGKEVKAAPPPVEEEDDMTDDERLVESQAATDPEREAIRERRREEKRKKKENFQNMKRELASRDAVINQMREELNILQRKSTGGEMAQIDQALKQTQEAYGYFKQQIAEATARADGETVANATEKMIQAGQKYAQLNQIKQGYQKQQAAPAPLDPRLVDNAQKWMERNDWYDPAAKDDDSEIMRTIDNKLAQDGWDPKDPSYWEELSRRGKKYLPHRFKDGTITPNVTKPRQTVAGSGRESGGSAGETKGFVLSAARVAAMKEAGIWDDPKRRASMIARYKEQDRNSGQR